MSTYRQAVSLKQVEERERKKSLPFLTLVITLKVALGSIASCTDTLFHNGDDSPCRECAPHC